MRHLRKMGRAPSALFVGLLLMSPSVTSLPTLSARTGLDESPCTATNLVASVPFKGSFTWDAMTNSYTFSITWSVSFDCSDGTVSGCVICMKTDTYYHVEGSALWYFQSESNTSTKSADCNTQGNGLQVNTTKTGLTPDTDYRFRYMAAPSTTCDSTNVVRTQYAISPSAP